MARSKGTMKISSNIEPRLGAPLDARMVVPTLADLTTSDNWDYAYVGMLVAVQATGKLYILKATPVTTANNWVEVSGSADLTDYYTKAEVDALVSATYKPSGSCTFANLPTLAAGVLGNVYNVTDSFTTTSDFVEGSGKTYPANTNVVVVNVGTTQSPSYKFDALSGLVDLTGYQTKMQYTTMPTATQSLFENDTVVQYTGVNTADYTFGHFYKVDAREPISGGAVQYIWTEIEVQESSGGGSGALETAITVTKAAGGIAQGDQYAVGTTYEKLWHDLLDPHLYPQLTAPTGVLTANVSSPIAKGSTPSVTFTLSLNRGSINPAYETNGYRSGEITGCKFDGAADYSTTYSYTVTVQAATAGDPPVATRFSKVYTGNVRYAAGERPTDSKGEYYEATALPAGNVDTNNIQFEFASPIYSNVSDLSQQPQALTLISASTAQKIFEFPACTASTPWIFDIPSAWTVTSIQTPDLFKENVWINNEDEWATSSTTHKDAANVDTDYVRYTWKMGIPADPRKIKITWTV